jgi:protein phosphatase
MGTEGAGASRAGGEGLHNEDAFLVEEGLGLYVVCDGASGTPAGEIASLVASEALEAFVESAELEFDLASGSVAREIVERAMRFALDTVLEAERAQPELRGLTTTVTMLLTHGRVGVIGHWGDSRAYLIRRVRAVQLTHDHELTAPASDGGSSEDESNSDVFTVTLQAGDTLVLCTDGAEEVVHTPEIVRVAGTLSPRILASRIVAAAHRRAPDQDATAVVVRVRREQEAGWLELSSPARGTTFGHTLQPT